MSIYSKRDEITREKEERRMSYELPEIYIFISQTGTLFSRALKVATRHPYNHVSISLDRELNAMYSFARRNIYCPWIAGFIEENPDEGMFKIKTQTRCQVYKLPLTPQQYEQLLLALDPFLKNLEQYRYNFLGLPFIWMGIPLNRRYHFVCSEFVAHLLMQVNIIRESHSGRMMRPYDFSMIEDVELIYEGYLREYTNDQEEYVVF